MVAEITTLKAQPDQNILKYGTGVLDRTLVENNLVDEFHFWIFPVVVGAGERLFNGIGDMRLNLVNTTRFKSGIVVLTYARGK